METAIGKPDHLHAGYSLLPPVSQNKESQAVWIPGADLFALCATAPKALFGKTSLPNAKKPSLLWHMIPKDSPFFMHGQNQKSCTESLFGKSMKEMGVKTPQVL